MSNSSLVECLSDRISVSEMSPDKAYVISINFKEDTPILKMTNVVNAVSESLRRCGIRQFTIVTTGVSGVRSISIEEKEED